MSTEKLRVLISQSPVATPDRAPLDLFDSKGVDYTLNPKSRILTEDEMLEIAPEFDVIFSGTSPLSRKVIEACPKLKFISRAGIGLDSVDLLAARERGIPVSYTPDAPAPAVAEFTLGMMLSLTRGITAVDRKMREGIWQRTAGARLENSVVGIIGMGRTGKLMVKYLKPFGGRIIAYALDPDMKFAAENGIEMVDFNTLLEQSDVISLHVPLSHRSAGMLSTEAFARMKPTARLVNTSRGGVVDEDALYDALSNGVIAAAAMDVFAKEPYDGPLAKLDNCILTSHMAAAAPDTSRAMEMGAAEEICRFIAGEPLQGLVPESEYNLRLEAQK